MSNTVAINFDKIKSYLAEHSSKGIEIDATNDADVLKALKNNQPFPDREIELGKITVGTIDDKNIEFETETGNAVFSGGSNASAFSGLGVYHTPQNLLPALALGDTITPSITQVNGEDSLFMLLSWGYDLGGNVKGTVALANPAKVTFGSEGKREALFAIVRRIPKSDGARSAVKNTIDSWIIPSRVDGIDDIDPGTWLITEVESAIDFKLGAQFGYDFDWVREAKLGGLTGDIGLRLQLGVDVALGFHASGKFALVIARESDDPDDKKLRLQLFKLRKKGWNFALDAKASADGDFDQFLPEQFDDFIKAVFGLHEEQFIKDLEAIEKWTDPDQDLPDLLGGVGADYLKEFVKKVTGLDPENVFEEAKGRLLGFLEKWGELDHEVATRLWKLAEENVSDLDKIKEAIDTITDADETKAKEYIENILADVDFYSSPVGKFLIDLLPREGLLTTLTDSQILGKLQEKAEKVSGILDGGAFQDLFENLQEEINSRLNLDKIKGDIDEAKFEDLDKLLKAKLSAFLGESLTLSRLDEIRKTIDLLLEKREEFYKKTLKALNKKYEFSLTATFQKNITNHALIDVTFDFSRGDVDDLLRDALKGKFDRLFVEKHDGVKLGTATLTHGIERQGTVELSLPFYKSTVTHINKSLAKVDAVDEDEGRILIYELGAKDVITRKNKRMSSLSIGGYFKTGTNRVRVFSERSLSYSYSFRQYNRKMKRCDLEYQLGPYIDTYFDALFNNTGDDTQTEPFSTWIGDLDETIDRLEWNGKDNFGPTFLSLDVSLPSEISSAWLKAPGDERASQYMDMSRNLQAALKKLIPYYYFQDIDNFKNRVPALVLLAYASIPPCTTVKNSRGRITEINTNKDIYWNWPDKDLQAAMLIRGETTGELSRNLFRVHHRLKSTPGMDKTARRYDPQNLTGILSELVTGIKSSQSIGIERLFHSLFFTEKEIIKGACKAGRTLAKFVSQSDSNPSEAVKSLTEFGENITETFNKNIKSIYGGEALRPLGSLMFIEAARAFDPQLADANTRALLDLVVLKQSVEEDYLDKALIPREHILMEERLIN